MPKLTHYIVVRADLPLGIQAAQIVHAVGESLNEPHKANTHSVVLSVPNEDALREAVRRLGLYGVRHKVIIEPDKPWNGQRMAIGVFPVWDREYVKKALSSLPLLKERSGDERVS